MAKIPTRSKHLRQARLTGMLIASAVGLSCAGASATQPPPGAPPEVTVRVGQALAVKTPRLGQRDVDEIVKELRDAVKGDLQGRHRANAPVRVDLVLEDATPNRPTAQQLGDNPSLSERSLALGGAAISGFATFADGHTEPLSYNFREISLQDEVGVTQWTDAERAFDGLGQDLAHGRIPHDKLDIRLADRSFDQWRP